MGQAKARGTLEQRIAKAIDWKRAEEENLERDRNKVRYQLPARSAGKSYAMSLTQGARPMGKRDPILALTLAVMAGAGRIIVIPKK